jgi:hypothetical protein
LEILAGLSMGVVELYEPHLRFKTKSEAQGTHPDSPSDDDQQTAWLAWQVKAEPDPLPGWPVCEQRQPLASVVEPEMQ